MTLDKKVATFIHSDEYVVPVDYRLGSRRTFDRLVTAWGRIGNDDFIYSPPNDILKVFFSFRPTELGVKQIKIKLVGINEPTHYYDVVTALNSIDGVTPLCACELISLATNCPHQLYGKKFLALGNILSVTDVTRGLYPAMPPSKKAKDRMYAIFLMITKIGICVRQHSLKDEKLPTNYLFPVKVNEQ